MGFLGEFGESVIDRVQAVKLAREMFSSSINPFVVVDAVPDIGELTIVDIRNGEALVIFPMKEAKLFPARNVHMYSNACVSSRNTSRLEE